jgi:hypothetical protein
MTTTNLVTVFMTVRKITNNYGRVTHIRDISGTELIIKSSWASTDNLFDIVNLRPLTRGGISFHLPASAKTILEGLTPSDTSQDLNWWYATNRINEMSQNLTLGVEIADDSDVKTRYVITTIVDITLDIPLEKSSINFLFGIFLTFLLMFACFLIFGNEGSFLTRNEPQFFPIKNISLKN